MINLAFDYMTAHPVPGVVCEFGVWTGNGIASMLTYDPTAIIYGFDTFEGMPKTSVALHDDQAEAWAPGGYKADYAQVKARFAASPNVTLIKGIFDGLLPLREYGISKVRLARLDCDLYESYRDALRLLTPTLQKGSLLLFDEGVAPADPRYHDSIRDSGERAIAEWTIESGVQLHVQESKWTEMLAVVI